jgi:thiol-disulfide isomerase/thioredoxin
MKKPGLITILVGIFIVLVGSFILVNILNPSYDYDSEEISQVSDWVSFQSQLPSEGYAVLYYYLANCRFCVEIKDPVLNFAAENKADVPVFIADVSNPLLTQTNQFNPANISGTPTMVVFFNGVVVDQFVGPTPILNMINAFEKGTYTHNE